MKLGGLCEFLLLLVFLLFFSIFLRLFYGSRTQKKENIEENIFKIFFYINVCQPKKQQVNENCFIAIISIFSSSPQPSYSSRFTLFFTFFFFLVLLKANGKKVQSNEFVSRFYSMANFLIKKKNHLQIFRVHPFWENRQFVLASYLAHICICMLILSTCLHLYF